MSKIKTIKARFLIASQKWDDVKKIGEDAIPPLISALKNKDWYDRVNAARILTEMGWHAGNDTEKAWYLIALQKWDDVEKIKEAAIEPLIATLNLHIPNNDPLMASLKNEGSKVARRMAVQTLGKIGTERALDPLIAALKDDDLFIRRVVAKALGDIGNKRAVKPLLLAIEDKDEYLREKAAEALGKIGDKQALEALTAATTDDNQYVKQKAIEALGKIQDKGTPVEPIKPAPIPEETADDETYTPISDQEFVSGHTAMLADDEVQELHNALFNKKGAETGFPDDNEVTKKVEVVVSQKTLFPEIVEQQSSAKSVAAEKKAPENKNIAKKRKKETITQCFDFDDDTDVNQIPLKDEPSLENDIEPPLEHLAFPDELAAELSDTDKILNSEDITLEDENKLFGDSEASLDKPPDPELSEEMELTDTDSLEQVDSPVATKQEYSIDSQVEEEDELIRRLSLSEKSNLEPVPDLDQQIPTSDSSEDSLEEPLDDAELLDDTNFGTDTDSQSQPVSDNKCIEDEEEFFKSEEFLMAEKTDAGIQIEEQVATSAVPPVSKLDQDKAVVPIAETETAEIENPEVIELITALKTDDEYGRWRAAERLGEIKDKSAVAPLIIALKDENRYVREKAVEALGNIGDNRTLESLIATLEDENPIVRYLAAEALEKIKDPRAIPSLIKALQDENRYVREKSAEALGNFKDQKALAPLAAVLSDDNRYVREKAAEALVKLNWEPQQVKEKANFFIAAKKWEEVSKLGEPAVDLLIESLLDEDKDVVCKAVWALGEIKDHRATEPLIAALDGGDDFIREQAANALGKLADEKAIDPLVKSLSDANAYVRQKAAEALGNIGSKKAIEPLMAALKDKNRYVREQSAEALGKIGDDKATTSLVEKLDDGNEFVREKAAEALGMIGDPKASESLATALKDENPYVREKATGALGKIGKTQNTTEPLILALQDNNPYVRQKALESLEKIEEPMLEPLIAALRDGVEYGLWRIADALQKINPNWPKSEEAIRQVPEFIKDLRNTDWRVRANAAFVLGKIKDSQVITPLCTALKDRNQIVRYWVVEALGEIKDQQAIEPLIEVLQDEDADEDVLRKAAWALGEIREARALEPLKEFVQKNPIPDAQEAVERIEEKIKLDGQA